MIIELSDTNTKEIADELLSDQEANSMATGRVLTLIVVASATDDVECILDTVREASHEHPARVLVMLTDKDRKESRLDARVIVGRDSGASELVVMRLSGEMADHLGSVVTPLLLPDTPIVAWWPVSAPARPSDHYVGRIAQRRVTNARHNVSGNALLRLTSGYAPGDSDMMWSRITTWRGIVASALDRYPHERVESAVVSGPADNPSVDIAAGWLAHRLGVTVERRINTPEDYPQTRVEGANLFPIHSLVLNRASGPISISVQDESTVRISLPDSPDAQVAMSVRTESDCLSEELRHLDADVAYAAALQGLGLVTVD
ncbi:glucose-6-phosphate dehydrogenase assembly protein OpcA [Corynebacterium uterequi]|uniref:Glucose-6-P dehydrogenase subunit n=1 Tax=Corynebacterium uterequi TaxID=1072256 RepID=A0A0G3HD06_9CORY|nr:glucose-6-phosphate dehydrogenase assembly protein OpcA [Corynebacterium uterequi]AKK11159.1 glucose-6-P dehydrogenase subunit [Corynebacterium uterequi]